MKPGAARLLPLCTALLLAAPAFASEKKAGLPQLDPEWFASQIFWLVVHFVLLYLIASRLILPRIAVALDRREGRIANDLEQADRLQKEAEQARSTYEQSLAGARQQAQATREEAAARAAAERVRAEQALAEDLAGRAIAANERIGKASAAMRERMRDVAAESAGDILRKVAGIEVDRATIDSALSRILDQRLQEVA